METKYQIQLMVMGSWHDYGQPEETEKAARTLFARVVKHDPSGLFRLVAITELDQSD